MEAASGAAVPRLGRMGVTVITPRCHPYRAAEYKDTWGYGNGLASA